MSLKFNRLTILALASLAAGAAHAQLTWPNCTDLAASQFVRVPLIQRTSTGAVAGVTAVDPNLREPVKMSIAKNGDLYLVERSGAIKLWKKATGTVVEVAKLPVYWDGKLPNAAQANNENGLTGIALDPNFESNKHIYLFYAPPTPSVLRISRFTLNGDALAAGSEKVMLDIPVQRNSCCHTGGGMGFDLQGNLFVTIGNNTTNPAVKAADAYLKESDADADDQGHAGNTNDLRGKIIRIKPKADGTYEVPDGNLFAKGTAKTKPEIWAMGIRNPYSLAVDKYRGWVAWGDVGPDDGLAYSEEWNLFPAPGNAGWPYFVGNQAWRPALGKVASAPVNNSPNNTGINNLPPAINATIGYQQSCAVTGPIFHYDGSINNQKKLPPHLNKKWLVTDWWKGNLEVVTMTDDGKSVVGTKVTLKQNNTFNGPLDLQVGPDGNLYVLEYGQIGGGLWFNNAANTSVSRLEYTGGCHPTEPTPTSIRDIELAQRGALVGSINLGLRREVEIPAGVKGFRLYDVQGRMAWEYKTEGNQASGKVSVPANVGSGVLRVKYTL